MLSGESDRDPNNWTYGLKSKTQAICVSLLVW